MSSIRYRPEVDGLRALAIVSVIFFHLSPDWLPGGFTGVDIFFVISGYLITSIICADHFADRFTLANFWKRRIQRILPALGAMIILVLSATLILGLPQLINEGGKQAVAATACVSNYRMLQLTSNYWSTQSDTILFLHTWSLAVEEQFYLIFPLLMAIAFSRSRLWVINSTIMLLFSISLAWCAWQASQEQARAFFLMPARAWELSAGAMLSVFEPRLRGTFPRLSPLLAGGGALLLFVSILVSGKEGFPWPMAGLPVLGAFFFIGFSESNGWVGRVFSCDWVTAIGKASYSLYLWHWPSLVIGGFVASAMEQPSLKTAFLFVGICLGWLSYVYIEPLGRRDSFIRLHAPLLVIGMTCLAFFCAFKKPSVNFGQFISGGWQVQSYDARFTTDFAGAALGVELSDSPVDMVLLGDSHALALAGELNSIMQSRSMSGAVFASGGTRIVNWRPTRYDLEPESRRCLENNRDNFLKKFQPRFVVLAARWETLDDPAALDALARLMRHITTISPRSSLVIVGQVPRFSFGDIKAYEWLNWRRRLGVTDLSLGVPVNPALQRMDANLAILSASQPKSQYVSVGDLFPVLNGRVTPCEGPVLLYEDDDHLSDAGARRVIGRLMPILTANSLNN